MSGIFQGEDEVSESEKRHRGREAAASVLGVAWQSTAENAGGFWHWCLCRWNRILGAGLTGQDCVCGWLVA